MLDCVKKIKLGLSTKFTLVSVSIDIARTVKVSKTSLTVFQTKLTFYLCVMTLQHSLNGS